MPESDSFGIAESHGVEQLCNLGKKLRGSLRGASSDGNHGSNEAIVDGRIELFLLEVYLRSTCHAKDAV